jgi:hypothetical protein
MDFPLQEASLADISYLFDEGALIDYETQELIKLVRALFADTPQRRNMVNKLMAGHAHSPWFLHCFHLWQDTFDVPTISFDSEFVTLGVPWLGNSPEFAENNGLSIEGDKKDLGRVWALKLKVSSVWWEESARLLLSVFVRTSEDGDVGDN